MRIVREVVEDEVVAAFLRGELASSRYGEKLRGLLGGETELVERPDLADASANRRRRALLDEHRAFERRKGLFAGFPERVDWFRAALTRAELLSILYIDWDWWLELSGGTRRPSDAAERIRRGAVEGVTAEEHEPFVRAVSDLIVVGRPGGARLVLLEGHVRLTACALFPERLPDELELYLGLAEDIERWSLF